MFKKVIVNGNSFLLKCKKGKEGAIRNYTIKTNFKADYNSRKKPSELSLSTLGITDTLAQKVASPQVLKKLI